MRVTLKPAARLMVNSALSVLPVETRRRYKRFHELRYWRRVIVPICKDRNRLADERSHFEYFFTGFFGLTRSDYLGKAILDVGCGPLGSLEWAGGARARIGLDPLADEYLALCGARQTMDYRSARAEAIPFPDAHFDCVASFNALDRADNVRATIVQMKRVTAPGGRILLIVPINHAAGPARPRCLNERLIKRFAPEFQPADLRLFGMRADGSFYGSLRDAVPYVRGEAGILAARLERAPG